MTFFFSSLNQRHDKSYVFIDLNFFQVSDVAHGPLVSLWDYNTIAKIQWRNLKSNFSRTTGPIPNNLTTMLLSVKGTQVCINNQQFNSQKEILIFFYLNKKCFAQMMLLIRIVSQVSDVTYWSLFFKINGTFITCTVYFLVLAFFPRKKKI